MPVDAKAKNLLHGRKPLDIIKPLLQDAAKLQGADVERRNAGQTGQDLHLHPLYDGKDLCEGLPPPPQKTRHVPHRFSLCEETISYQWCIFRLLGCATYLSIRHRFEIKSLASACCSQANVGPRRSIQLHRFGNRRYEHVICRVTMATES